MEVVGEEGTTETKNVMLTSTLMTRLGLLISCRWLILDGGLAGWSQRYRRKPERRPVAMGGGGMAGSLGIYACCMHIVSEVTVRLLFLELLGLI